MKPHLTWVDVQSTCAQAHIPIVFISWDCQRAVEVHRVTGQLMSSALRNIFGNTTLAYDEYSLERIM